MAADLAKTAKNNDQQTQQGVEPQPEWLLFIAVIIGSLIVRLAYLASVAPDPWLQYPIVDEITYRDMARELLASDRSPYPLFYPPLWSYVLAVWSFISGSLSDFLQVRLLNAVIGSFSVGLAYRIARRMFNRKIALVSASIASLTGVLVHLHTTGLITPVFMLLFYASILLTLIATERTWSSSRLLAVLAGVLWGLTTLARPTALIAAVVAAIWIAAVGRGPKPIKALKASRWLFASRTRRSKRKRFDITLGLMLLLGLVLPILPITLLNIANGDFIIISNNGGPNFYFGNYPGASGYSPEHPTLGTSWTADEIEQWASEQAGRQMSPSEASGWYYRQGLQNWLKHPGDMLALLGKKAVLLFGGLEISNNGDWDFFADRRPMLRILLIVGFWWILPAALVGIAITRRNRNIVFILLMVAAHLLPVLAFFVNSRFRAPVLPLLAPFAVYAFAYIFNRKLKVRPRVLAAIALVVLGTVLNFGVNALGPPPGQSYGHLIQALLHHTANQPQEASEQFLRALQANPKTPVANLHLGDMARAAGNYELAIEHYRAENKLKPRERAYRGLGISFRQLGMHDSALTAFERAYEMRPGDPTLRKAIAEEIGEQALAASEQGQWREALKAFTKAQRIALENPFFAFGRANAIWSLGDTVHANRLVDSLLVKHPDFPPAKQWAEGWRP